MSNAIALPIIQARKWSLGKLDCRVWRKGSKDKEPGSASYRKEARTSIQESNAGLMSLPHYTMPLYWWTNSPRSQGWCGNGVTGPSGLLTKRLVQFNLPLISDYCSHCQLKAKPYLETRGERHLRLMEASYSTLRMLFSHSNPTNTRPAHLVNSPNGSIPI